MGTGYIIVKVLAPDNTRPVGGAQVTVTSREGDQQHLLTTDYNGNTRSLAIPVPDIAAEDQNRGQLVYALFDVDVRADGYPGITLRGVHIVDTATSILPVLLPPRFVGLDTEWVQEINLPPHGLVLLPESANRAGPLEDELTQIQKELARGTVSATNQETVISALSINMSGAQRDLDLVGAAEFTVETNKTMSGYEPRVLGLSTEAPRRPTLRTLAESPEALPESELEIPEYIKVHQGAPSDMNAEDITIKFSDYIKNVLSSEINPRWPLDSLITNVHVAVSFALNRLVTKWYREQGFDFDITGDPGYDQYYRQGAEVYENISQLVDDYLGRFVRRKGHLEPYFTQYCNGVTVTCTGLSQAETVALANRGMTPLQILREFYPEDIEIVVSRSAAAQTNPYPGAPLGLGSIGANVRLIQSALTELRKIYPVIHRIAIDGIFGDQTRRAVIEFQRANGLAPDGIVGPITWDSIFNAK